MVEVGINLLVGIIGLTIFVGYLASVFFDRTKIPDVLLLIFMGVLIGPIGGYVDPAELISWAPLIGTIALIIIVFEGGTKLNFFEVLDELPESIWFTIFVCSLTSIMAMTVFILGLGWGWAEGLLAGIIISGTSFEIIVPLIDKLSIPEKARTLLNLESALNSVVTIVGVMIVINYITSQSIATLDPIQYFISTFAIAIFLGALSGILWLKVLQNYKGKPFEYLLTLGFVFLLFAITQMLEGNGITAVLLFGLILGNSDALAKYLNIKEDFSLDPAIAKFNSEVSFFVRTMFFVYVGIILQLDKVVPTVFLAATFIFLAAVVARALSVKVLISANPSLKQSEFVIFSMLPRGLSTAVLAALPLSYGISLEWIIEIVLIFMLLSDFFATITAFYFETRIAQKGALPSALRRK